MSGVATVRRGHEPPPFVGKSHATGVHPPPAFCWERGCGAGRQPLGSIPQPSSDEQSVNNALRLVLELTKIPAKK